MQRNDNIIKDEMIVAIVEDHLMKKFNKKSDDPYIINLVEHLKERSINFNDQWVEKDKTHWFHGEGSVYYLQEFIDNELDDLLIGHKQ